MSILDLFQQDRLIFLSVVVIFALLIGSFLNVVIHRIPIMLNREWKRDCIQYLSDAGLNFKHEQADSSNTYNLITPRSACPHCGHQITALENIPIISYLFLGGKCSECKAKISARYPLVEALTAVLSLTVAWKFGVSWQTLAALFLTWNLIALSYIDYDHKLLPDQMTLPFVWIGLLLNTQHLFIDLTSAVIGAVAGYMTLWLVYQLFKLITKK